MKKKLSILFVSIMLIVTCLTLVGCNTPNTPTIPDTPSGNESVNPDSPNTDNETTTPSVKVKIAVPDGAPALSMTTLIKDGLTNKNNNLELNIINPEQIVPQVAGKKVDMAILPSTAAFKLFMESTKNNDTDPYVMAATATYGNLFIVGKTPITVVNDSTILEASKTTLTGKIVYIIGDQNKVPFKIFNTIYNNSEKNLIKVITKENEATAQNINVIFKNDGPTVIRTLKTSESADIYGLLGEPAVTGATAPNNGTPSPLKRCVDIQQAYADKVCSTTLGYPQAILVVKKSFLQDNKAIVDDVVAKMVETQTYIAKAENKAGIADILRNNKYGQVSAMNFPAPSIAGCNIVIKSAVKAKEETKTFINNLTGANIPDAFFASLDL